MKLKKRLLTLSEMVKQPYSLVWDCCCDHGLLGFKVLADGIIKKVNFVDVMPDIIDSLNLKLTQYSHHLPDDVQWQTFCNDTSDIILPEDLLSPESISSETANQLIIISGVGGELITEILDKLLERYSGYNIDYLLCPVQHTYKLRKKLSQHNFKLKHEQLIVENKRGYELLLVNQLHGKRLSVTGNEIWLQETDHKNYLSKLIKHYQRTTTKENSDYLINQNALSAYRLTYEEYYRNK